MVIFDLDNVLLDCESIDEIAKLKNLKEEISEITKKAMEGELDFESSIKKRVKLLKGIPIKDIKSLAKKLPLMNGAKETIEELKARGCKVVTITGGFDIVAEEIKKKLGIDYVVSNKLHVKNGVLTGKVSGPLVKGSKYDVLCKLLKKENISFDECIAVGDGANDIPILEAVKVGIAFNAKPIVKKIADVVINEKDLRKIIPIVDNVNNKDLEILEKELDKVIDKKTKYEKKKAILIKERNKFNSKARKYRKIRNELNRKVQENLKLALDYREKRDKINEKVKKYKNLRSEFIEKSKKLKWDPINREKRKIMAEIKRIENKIETGVLSIQKENELIEKVGELGKKLKKIRKNEKIKEEAHKLKNKAKECHEKVLTLAKKSQEYHEKMLKHFKKVDKLREKADDAHKRFVKYKKEADKKHEEIEKIMSKINKINKKIRKLKDERERIIKSFQNKKEFIEKRRAKKIYQKFKRGKKLTTDELLLIQKHDII